MVPDGLITKSVRAKTTPGICRSSRAILRGNLDEHPLPGVLPHPRQVLRRPPQVSRVSLVVDGRNSIDDFRIRGNHGGVGDSRPASTAERELCPAVTTDLPHLERVGVGGHVTLAVMVIEPHWDGTGPTGVVERSKHLKGALYGWGKLRVQRRRLILTSLLR